MLAAKFKWLKKIWKKWTPKRNRSMSIWLSRWCSWDKHSRQVTQLLSKPNKTRSICRMKRETRYKRSNRWWSRDNSSYRIWISWLNRKRTSCLLLRKWALPEKVTLVLSPSKSNCKAKIYRQMILRLFRFPRTSSLHILHSWRHTVCPLPLPQLNWPKLHHHLNKQVLIKRNNTKQINRRFLPIHLIKLTLLLKKSNKLQVMKPRRQNHSQSQSY